MKAGVLPLCLALIGCSQPGPDDGPKPRYQMAVDGKGDAWRLDTVTGKMSECYRARDAGPDTAYCANVPDRPK